MGKCIRCGCTDEEACDHDGSPCFWVDQEHTLCSACLTEEEVDHLVSECRDPDAAPPLERVGPLGSFEVYSPGTWVAGEGWRPLGPMHRAMFGAAAEPVQLLIPFGSGSKSE